MKKLVALFFLGLTLSAVPARAEQPIKIGAVFSLSSWGAHGGQTELNGAMMARDEINASGGILGRPLELVVEDTQSDLKHTASAFRKLIAINKVPVIIGPNWAEFAEVAVAIAEGAKVPFISPSGYSEGMLTGKRFAFTLQPPHSISARPLAELLKKRGYKSISVVLTENAYLNGIYEGIKKNLVNPDAILKPVLRFNPEQSDFRSVISRIKKSDADAVLVLLIEGGALHTFFVQAKQLNLGLPLYSANGIPYDAILMKNLSMAEGVTYFDYLILGGPEFIKRYTERFDEEPGFASGRAYDAVYLVKSAIEKCGTQPDQIRNCLSSSNYSGLTGSISFDHEGLIQNVDTNTHLLQVRNGKQEKLRM